MRKSFLFYSVMLAILALACQNASTSSVSNTVANMNTAEVNNAAVPASANSAAAPDAQKDDAPRISLADAKAAFDSGEAYFIDTRGAEQFKTEHIKGAVNITVAEIGTKASSIPKNKKIIAYCS